MQQLFNRFYALKRSISPLWRLLRQHAGYLTVLALFSTLGAVLVLGDVLVVAAIIDNLSTEASLDTHLLLFFLLFFFIVSRHCLVFIENGVSFALQTILSLELRGKLFGSILRAEKEEMPPARVGEMVHLETATLSVVQSHLTDGVTNLFNSVLLLCVSVYLMFQFNTGLALIFLAAATVWFLVSLVFYPYFESHMENVYRVTSDSRAVFVDSMYNASLVNILGAGPQLVKKYLMQLLSESLVAGKLLRFNLLQDIYSSTLPVLLVLVSYLYGGYLVLAGEISLGQMVAFNLISSRAVAPLNSILDYAMGLSGLKVSCEKLFAQLDLDFPLQEKVTSRSFMNSTPNLLTHNLGAAAGGRELFQKLNFKLEPASTVLVSGPSGSGKSTLLACLAGIKEPGDGEVRLSGVKTADVERNHIQLVPAQPVFFNLSVYQNLQLGLSVPLSDVELESYLSLTGCSRFVHRTDEGLHTVIEEDLSPFSKGELQRLALCRAISFRPAVLLLDEALSGLEQSLEREIIFRIQRRFPELILIIATHRTNLDDLPGHRITLG